MLAEPSSRPAACQRPPSSPARHTHTHTHTPAPTPDVRASASSVSSATATASSDHSGNPGTPRKQPSKPSWHALSSRLRAIRSAVHASIPRPHSHTYHCPRSNKGTDSGTGTDTGTGNHNHPQLLVHASDTQLFLNHQPILSSDTWEPLLRRAKFAPVHPLAAAWKRALSERQRRPISSGIVLLRSLSISCLHHDIAIAIVFSIRATVFCAYVDLPVPLSSTSTSPPSLCSSVEAVPLAALHLPGAYDVKVILPRSSHACSQPASTSLTIVWIDATRNGGQLCSCDIPLPNTTFPSSRQDPSDSAPLSAMYSRSSSSLSLWPSWLRPTTAPLGPAPALSSPVATIIDSPNVSVLTDSANSPVAIPDYVSSEEFSRFTGYWPSPCGHFLLYTTLDTANVPLVHIGADPSVRYPRAGSPNVRTHLHMLHLPTGRSVSLCTLDAELREWGAEYLTRAGWVDERMIWAQVCSRDQSKVAVFVAPVEACGTAGRMATVWEEHGVDGKWVSTHSTLAFLPRGPLHRNISTIRLVIASEKSGFMDLYLSSLDLCPTSPLSPPTVIRLTRGPPFTVSRTEPLVILPLSPTSNSANYRVLFHVRRMNASDLVESALCSLDIGLADVDQSEPAFAISMWTPPGLDAHLIAHSSTTMILSISSIDHPPTIKQINTNLLHPNPSHPASHVFSTLAPPASLSISCLTSTTLRPRLHVFPTHPNFPLSTFVWLPPTAPLLPAGFPTVLHVYAGPDVAAVTNDWYTTRGGGAIVRVAALVELGFAVVVVDGRGSMHPERGAAWEAGLVKPSEEKVKVRVGRSGRRNEHHAHSQALDEVVGSGYFASLGLLRGGGGGPKGDQIVVESRSDAQAEQKQQDNGRDDDIEVDRVLGDGELADQLDALDLLVAIAGVPLDLARVAMVGWSYGGYLSLMGLAKHSSRVKLVVAGAPVTCWTHYDTAYSERFLGVPASLDDDSEDARRVCAQFQASSVLAHVHRFPKEPNRLFLVHGQLDDNVHKSHHLDPLIDALVDAGVPHSVQLYPHERHGLRQVHTIEHYETQLLWWLTQYL